MVLALISISALLLVLYFHHGRFGVWQLFHGVFVVGFWLWAMMFDLTLVQTASNHSAYLIKMCAMGMSLWAWIFLTSLVLAYAKSPLSWRYYGLFAMLFSGLGASSVLWMGGEFMKMAAMGYALGIVIALLVRNWVHNDRGITNTNEIKDPIWPVFNFHND